MFTDTMTLTEMQKEVGKDYDPFAVYIIFKMKHVVSF